jgi:hypothetical protein
VQVFFVTMDQPTTGGKWILSVLANDVKQARLLARRVLPDAEIVAEKAGPKRPEVFDMRDAREKPLA